MRAPVSVLALDRPMRTVAFAALFLFVGFILGCIVCVFSIGYIHYIFYVMFNPGVVSEPEPIPFVGHVVFQDESGNLVRCPNAELRVFSHYAPKDERRLWRREQNLQADHDGSFDVQRLAFETTIYASSPDRKYSVIISLDSEEQHDDFQIELLPRISIKGKCIDEKTGEPIVHAEKSLSCYAWSDQGDDFIGKTSEGINFHHVKFRTDSSGEFVLHGFISCAEYELSTYTHRGGKKFRLPDSRREGMEQPYDLGVFSFPPRDAKTVPCCRGCLQIRNFPFAISRLRL